MVNRYGFALRFLERHGLMLGYQVKKMPEFRSLPRHEYLRMISWSSDRYPSAAWWLEVCAALASLTVSVPLAFIARDALGWVVINVLTALAIARNLRIWYLNYLYLTTVLPGTHEGGEEGSHSREAPIA
ncbi:MAG: hypothetical protein HZB26_11650 [Candidatus Hydrogenedentes bacterium]|nr:hypothetical protein [Candidatus Hydrogenedentota bacterium]